MKLDFGTDGRLVGWSAPTIADSGRLDWEPGRVTVTAADDSPAVFEFDQRASVIRTTDPTGLITTYNRDLARRVTSATAGPRTFRFGHDARGRVDTITDARGTVSTITSSPAGRPVAVAHGDVALTFDLDPAGLVDAVRDGGGAELVSYQRDACGRLTRATNHHGHVEVRYGEQGRISAVTDLDGAATTYERDPDGLIVRILPDEGPAVTCLRSARGEVTGYEVAGATFAVPAIDRPGVDYEGGRITVDAGGRTYRYDHAGRLIEAVTPDGARSTFGYDELSQLATESTPMFGPRRFSYNTVGQLVAIDGPLGTTTFAYDSAGRRVQERRPDGGGTEYHWDDLTQLVAVTTTGPDGVRDTNRIVHSGLGRPERIADITIGWDDATFGKPIRIGADHYLRSGMAVRRIDDIDDIDRAPGAGGIPSNPEHDPGWDDGTRDDPWGATGTDGVHLGFRGELALGNLLFLGARVYDTDTRQFLSMDPAPLLAGLPGSLNPYAYTWCDPVNQIDPAGLQPISVADFENWRTEQLRNRLESAGHAIAEDPWGTVAVVAVVALGTAAIVFSGGLATPLVVAGGAAVIGSVIYGGYGYATKTFDPSATAAAGVISGVAAGGTVLLAPALVPTLGSTGGWMAAGAAGGAVSGGGTSATTQAIRTGGDVDLSQVGRDTIVGLVAGGAGGAFAPAVSRISPALASAGTSKPGALVLGVGTGAIDYGVNGVVTGDYSLTSLGVSVLGGGLADTPSPVRVTSPAPTPVLTAAATPPGGDATRGLRPHGGATWHSDDEDHLAGRRATRRGPVRQTRLEPGPTGRGPGTGPGWRRRRRWRWRWPGIAQLAVERFRTGVLRRRRRRGNRKRKRLGRFGWLRRFGRL